MSRMIAAIFSVCLMLPAAAVAHDASKHKGKPIQGEVVSVTKDGLELKPNRAPCPSRSRQRRSLNTETPRLTEPTSRKAPR